MSASDRIREDRYAGVFDRMLQTETRRAFLERKRLSYNSTKEECDRLQDYLLSKACTTDIQRLKEGDFFFQVPELIMLRKNASDRRRRVYRFREKENMLFKLMAYVLHDFDALFPDSLYSFRRGKKIEEIFRTINKHDYSKTHWVVRTDIQSFGDHVAPAILTSQLEALFGRTDPALLHFFDQLLNRGEYFEKGILKRGSTGALSGCALTNFFENIYLLDVDQMLQERSPYHCRFADDIAVFLETENEAVAVMEELERMLEEKQLRFNESKTMITAPGERFELLGFCIEKGMYDIADNSRKKIERKLLLYAGNLVRQEHMGELAPEDAMRRMIDRIDEYFFGASRRKNELNWADWAFHILTRPDSLRQIDHAAQDCIRIVGSGGKKTNAKYRVRYRDMHRMGYRTLVHAYHHGFERRQSGLRT